MRILSAFVRRDLAYFGTSKFAVVGQLASVLMMCAMMFFIGRTFGGGSAARRLLHGGYFEFVIIGIIFARFQSVALTSFSAAIRRDQVSHTLEAILATRATVSAIVLGTAASSFFFTAVQAALFLIIAATIFGVNLSHADPWTALAALALSMMAICPIGICAAASVIAFRKGEAALGMVTAATNVLGGVYFPIAVLPGPLKILSAIFPITHGLAAMREAILHGAGFHALAPSFAVLALFALIGIPLALVLFAFSIAYARRVGSLAYA